MSIKRISGEQALTDLAHFDAIIDARSESEFAQDRLPGAINWPSLRDAEREHIGTLYKQVDPFKARKIGATLVARNVAAHIERECLDKPKRWQPLVYCWRGGQRSGALSLILGQIGFRVTVIEGGYKAFRQAMLADLPARVQHLRYRVICGPTGSGKTRLLQALRECGAQVLDLETLASHRASVLGIIPGHPQPTQKHFEMLIWQTLCTFDPAQPVYVEAESKKVGNLALSECLLQAMRASECLKIELPVDERVALLMQDYPFFVEDTEFFCQRLDALVALCGRSVIESWQAQARAGQTEEVVRQLLSVHYDPGYAKSTERNFTRFNQALTLRLDSPSRACLQHAARQLLESA